MSTATDITTAQQWCETARKLLGKKLLGTSDNTRMREAEKSIRKVLADAKNKLPKKLYESLEKEYRELAGQAHDIAESNDSKENKAKDLEPIVKGLTDLDEKLSTAVGECDEYSKLKGVAEKRRDELANLNFDKLVYETEVAEAIRSAEKKVAVDRPDYNSASDDLKGTEAFYKDGKERAKTDLKNSETYKKELPKAEEKLRELKVLKHGKQEYHNDVAAEIKNAGDAAAKDPPDYAAAVQAIQKVEGLYQKAKKEAETAVSGELSTAEHKPVYEDKRGRIQAAIKELEPLPGTGKQVQKLKDLLEAGDKELKSSKNYAEAYKKLAGLSGALKEGKEASEKLVNGGGKDFQQARTEALGQINDYNKLAGLAAVKAVAGFRKRYDNCIRTLEGDPDEKVIQQAVTDMQKLRDDAKGKAEEFTKRREKCDEAWKEAGEEVAKVKISAPLDVYEKVLASFREGEALRSMQKPIAARKQFVKTAKDAKNELKLYYAEYESWNKIATEVDRDYLAEIQEVQGLNLAAVEGTLVVLTEYATAKDVMGRTHEFHKGILAAQAVKDTVVKTIRPALTAYKNLEEIRAKGIQENDELKASVEGRIRQLEEQKGDGEAYSSAVSKAWSAFTKVCRSTGKKEDLEAAVKTCHDEMFRLGDELGDLLRNKDGALDKNQETAAPKLLKKEFDRQLRELEQLIEGLGGEFPEDAKPYKKQLDEELKKIAAPTKEDFEKVKTAVEEVGKAKTDRDNERKLIAGEVDKLGEQCVAAAKKLRSDHKKFKPFLDELDLEIKDLVSMANSSVKSVVAEGKKRLQAMLLELPKKGGKLDDITKRLAAAEKKLDDDTAKKLYPLRVKTLKARLESAVEPECYKSDPATAEKTTLKPFEEDLEQLADAVQKAADTRKNVDDLAGKIRDSLKKQLEDSPKLKASFEARIKAAETPAENGETKALEDLNKLKLLVDKCLETTDEAASLRTTLEQRAGEQEFRDSKAEKEWIAALNVFEKNTQRSAAAIYDKLPRTERNSTAYKAIATQLKEAKKLAGKKSFAQANEALAEARKAAERFVANPLNSATTARRQLAKVENRWAGDVAAFIHKLNGLCETISEELKADGVKDDVIASTLAPVRKLAGLFDAEIFKPIVATLGKKLPKQTAAICKEMPKRRSAKELGLRHVVRYQQAVENNPVLKLLEEHNPFVGPAESDFRSAIIDCLRDLELNLKRA